MRWLITGGCGFIGTALIRALRAEGGHRIRVVDDLSAATRDNLKACGPFRETPIDKLSAMAGDADGDVELTVGDIADADLAHAAAAGAGAIVHLAAGARPSVEDPVFDCRSNVLGTLNYLEAARSAGVGRFVFASSGATTGDCVPPLHEEMAPHPVSPHGAGKLAGEGYCSAYFRSFGVETVALRFGNVYGPGSAHKASVVAKLIRRALDGEALEIYGDGKQTRDFIFVEDAVRAVRLAATTAGIGGEVFQIATGKETTVGEIVDKLVPLLAAAGYNRTRMTHSAPQTGDVSRRFFDTAKARDLLGWQAEMPLRDGLRRTIEWFVARADVTSPA